ncbi:hypothetical protein [Nocardioides dongxiaopingii]|uniref:hypothetical protein n=1 Tax=Nocardioides sp. S-1144 TaxID=2582905 RepID=UPI001C9E78BA|nr:hypothetical protein [Nocardioides sp. S-1144]
MRRLASAGGALVLALGCGLVAGVPAPAPATAAAAVDTSKGTPGFCPDDTGVTVVVDFQELGGDPIVRCNPTGSRGTGLDALQGSGIQVEGVQRWGLAFVCRVENRPSAVETLAIEGDEDYREACLDTPPASGYWSYWHAGNNCAWTYSQWGVKNRDFVAGGFEGWSFSLNARNGDNPGPRVAAVRPGTEGGPCVEPRAAAPAGEDPLAQQQPPDAPAAPDPAPPGSPGPGTGPDAGQDPPVAPGGSAGRDDLPAPRPRDPAPPAEGPGTAADPADDVEFTDGEAAPDVRDTVENQVGASDLAPWVAAAAMLLLAASAVLTSRRRRRARDGA